MSYAKSGQESEEKGAGASSAWRAVVVFSWTHPRKVERSETDPIARRLALSRRTVGSADSQLSRSV